ncbi:MAG: hypothetical protein WC969_08025 [Elusimicrobiota bacterium]|jgi:hypothetical protein
MRAARLRRPPLVLSALLLSLPSVLSANCGPAPNNGWGAGYAAYAAWCTGCGGRPYNNRGTGCDMSGASSGSSYRAPSAPSTRIPTTFQGAVLQGIQNGIQQGLQNAAAQRQAAAQRAAEEAARVNELMSEGAAAAERNAKENAEVLKERNRLTEEKRRKAVEDESRSLMSQMKELAPTAAAPAACLSAAARAELEPRLKRQADEESARRRKLLEGMSGEKRDWCAVHLAFLYPTRPTIVVKDEYAAKLAAYDRKKKEWDKRCGGPSAAPGYADAGAEQAGLPDCPAALELAQGAAPAPSAKAEALSFKDIAPAPTGASTLGFRDMSGPAEPPPKKRPPEDANGLQALKGEKKEYAPDAADAQLKADSNSGIDTKGALLVKNAKPVPLDAPKPAEPAAPPPKPAAPKAPAPAAPRQAPKSAAPAPVAEPKEAPPAPTLPPAPPPEPERKPAPPTQKEIAAKQVRALDCATREFARLSKDMGACGGNLAADLAKFRAEVLKTLSAPCQGRANTQDILSFSPQHEADAKKSGGCALRADVKMLRDDATCEVHFDVQHSAALKAAPHPQAPQEAQSIVWLDRTGRIINTEAPNSVVECLGK